MTYKTFFHETSLEGANAIISEQEIRPSKFLGYRNPLFGPGIYFAMTINGAHTKSNNHGYCLSADVLITKTKEMDKQDGIKFKNNRKYWENLRNEGYDAIYGYGLNSGDEVVIFNKEQVKNIKFIKFGEAGLTERPIDTNWNLENILRTRNNKITLFYVTNLEQALEIESTQKIPNEDGKFGNSIYLFNTVEDAINHHPNGNTFISVYADMTNYYILNPDERLDSPNIPSNTKSFYIEDNSVKYFLFTDPSLIASIHICGDSGINKEGIGEIYITGIPLEKEKDTFDILGYEAKLRSIFQDYGILHSSEAIMIKTKNLNDDNLCAFALIKVSSREQAEKAVKNLNFTKINDRPICLFSIDQETEKLVQTDEGKIFVQKVDITIDITQIFNEFSKYGEIVSIEFPSELNDGRYTLKGFGSIQFRNPAVATDIILQQVEINGHPLEIEDFQSRQQLIESKNFVNCFIRNLPETLKDDELENLFAQFGTPVQWKVMTDENGRSRQYGYCRMEKHEEAVQAIQNLNGHNLNGTTLQCSRAMKSSERMRQRRANEQPKGRYSQYIGRQLHVSNLEKSVSHQELNDIFSPYGQIEFITIVGDKKNADLNTGFVVFKTNEEASNCVQNMSSVTIHSLNCSVWLSKGAKYH